MLVLERPLLLTSIPSILVRVYSLSLSNSSLTTQCCGCLYHQYPLINFNHYLCILCRHFCCEIPTHQRNQPHCPQSPLLTIASHSRRCLWHPSPATGTDETPWPTRSSSPTSQPTSSQSPSGSARSARDSSRTEPMKTKTHSPPSSDSVWCCFPGDWSVGAQVWLEAWK